MMSDAEKALAFKEGNIVKLRAHTRASHNIMSPNGYGLIVSSKNLFTLDVFSMQVLVAGKIVTVFCDDVWPLA